MALFSCLSPAFAPVSECMLKLECSAGVPPAFSFFHFSVLHSHDEKRICVADTSPSLPPPSSTAPLLFHANLTYKFCPSVTNEGIVELWPNSFLAVSSGCMFFSRPVSFSPFLIVLVFRSFSLQALRFLSGRTWISCDIIFLFFCVSEQRHVVLLRAQLLCLCNPVGKRGTRTERPSPQLQLSAPEHRWKSFCIIQLELTYA